MSLLELLHKEKVVKILENIDNQLKDLTEPSSIDNSIFLKVIMILETLLFTMNHKNKHIGEYFNRYYDNQREIDDSNEKIKMKNVEISKLQYQIDMLKAELEDLKWKPTEIKSFIEEPAFNVDNKGHEGWIFDKLREELEYNKKLNYNYGREEN